MKQFSNANDSFNAYDDYIDDVCDEVIIGCSTFKASRVLRELDATAYSVGFSEWLNSNEKVIL